MQTRHLCDNCQQVWTNDRLITPIPDMLARICPGETVPSGECPECHSLCHPVTSEAHYVLIMWEDIEPNTEGPFVTEEERDQYVLAHREKEGPENGLFMLDIVNGVPVVNAYYGGFFHEHGL